MQPLAPNPLRVRWTKYPTPWLNLVSLFRGVNPRAVDTSPSLTLPSILCFSAVFVSRDWQTSPASPHPKTWADFAVPR